MLRAFDVQDHTPPNMEVIMEFLRDASKFVESGTDRVIAVHCRGGKGRIDMKLSAKNGTPVAAFAVSESDDVVVISRMGQLVRIPADSISRYGRGTQGVRVAGLKNGDAVIAATRVVESDDETLPAEGEVDASEA